VRIHQLSPSIVTKIAAGEVIERPASVVKELLENSIDAGSTRIDIELDQGGIERILIVDDGHGIDPEDMALVFASHATSKLREADDLFRIATLGFRGEAMASIGGISQVTLQSRAEGRPLGSQIACNGSELSVVQPWSGAFGTRLEVRHLFYNVPVRRKFLKSSATEVGHVTEVVTRLALSHPNVHWTLKNNARKIYEIPASAGLPERMGLFFGRDVQDNLYQLQGRQGDLSIFGLIADPKCDRGNSRLQYLFLNGRWIRDRSLGHAIQDAYRNLLMVGRYAVVVLFVQMPPDMVDVNVHPTKSEVRFRDASAVFHLVRGSIRQTLLEHNLIPMLSVPEATREPFRVDAGPDPRDDAFRIAPATDSDPVAAERFGTVSPRRTLAESTPAPWDDSTPFPRPEPAVPATLSQPRPAPPIPAPGLGGGGSPTVDRLFADAGSLNAIQIHDSYLVVETAEGMLVIDQHALHERILFEQFQKRFRNGTLEIQRLLIPEPIDLPPDQAAIVLEAADALAQLGLEISDFGGNTILLSGYPTLLKRATPSEILTSAVDYLVSKDRLPTRDAMLNDLLATMACKAAVKAGDRLTPEEVGYLMQLRSLAENSHHCPHGRPTSLTFSRHELEKQFRRI